MDVVNQFHLTRRSKVDLCLPLYIIGLILNCLKNSFSNQ